MEFPFDEFLRGVSFLSKRFPNQTTVTQICVKIGD